MKFTLSTITILCSTAFAAPIIKPRGFNYGTDKVRGVNLGGWLVLEPWITPSLWDGFSGSSNPPVDEYHLMQAWGDQAQSKMEEHWSTWFSESDFSAMASAGLNTVRIPIGYWAFWKAPGDPYVQGQEAYLDKAIGWARNHGIMVWIDLHGAPGSQNGFDNSGIRGDINWQKGDTVKQTIAVLNTISNKYAKDEYSDVVSGIELLNEPLGPDLDMDTLTQFYKDGFGQVKQVSNMPVVLEDAFQNPSYWNGVLSTGGGNVLVDHHHYQIFSPSQVATSPADQVKAACGSSGEIAGADKWVVVGEFSSAMTDCAIWLNGYGRGSRYAGQYDNSPYVGSCDNKYSIDKFSQTDKDNTRRFIEAQLDTFETQQGWIYWTWKTENSAEWDMQKQIKAGIFPQPLTDRKFPGQCS